MGCQFCFIKNFIIKNYFLFLFVAVAFFANGFFISNIEKVYAEDDESITENVITSAEDISIKSLSISAASENITQLNITTNSQSIDVNTQSSIITVQTQNINGESEQLSETTHIILSSTSPTGVFYNANSTSCTAELISPFELTMNKGWSNKGFCYKDSIPGTYTLTVSAEGKDWIPVNQDIVIKEDSSSGDTGDEDDEENDEEDPILTSYTEVTKNITEDTTWTEENSPYVLEDFIDVEVGAILTIEEGTVIKFGIGTGLNVYGNLEALGSENKPVYFTSLLDDSIGGDTNGDGSNSVPEFGNWDQIFVENSGSQLIIDNAFEKYSGLGIILSGGSVISSNNFNSDRGILLFESSGSFSNLSVSSVEAYDSSTVSIENSNIINQDDAVVVAYNGSSIDIKDSEIEGIYNIGVVIIGGGSGSSGISSLAAISVYNSSSMRIDNSKITSNYDGIKIRNNSSLDIENSQIDCIKSGIEISKQSSLNFLKGTISGLAGGVFISNGATINISEATISDSLYAGIYVYGNTNSVNIMGSEIKNNDYGFMLYDSAISVHNNSIHDNLTYGVSSEFSEEFLASSNPVVSDFTSNYWGDKTGPTHSTNPSGLGDNVSDNVLFTPFLVSDPFIVEEVRNPVILIPGITGTYLYKNYDDYGEIWPNVGKMFLSPNDDFLDDLILNEDGSENIEFPIIPKDIIRGISSVHVFDGLIEELTNAGYIEGTDLFVFPYDWRKSTSENSVLLKEKIDEILTDNNSEKIDVIAHSMGGLLAKEYIAQNGQDKVDQLIFLGTPQLGAPKAFKVLMFGDDMGYKKLFLGLNRLEAKNISQNMPSVYELLPSSQYINLNGGYATNTLSEDGPITLDYVGTKNFLINEGRNSKMFPFAEDLHDEIDNLDLSGIKSYNFVGCGMSTIGKITVKEEKSWIGKLLGKKEDYEIGYTDGDETVPMASSTKTIGSEIYYVNDITHGMLPSAIGVKENILAILNDKGLTFGDSIKDDDSYCGIEGDVLSTHSPVKLHIYDKEGNHVGPNADGDIEYEIPGVQYDVIDDINYVFLPTGNNYRVVTEATNTGGFNLKIEKQIGEEITQTYNWTLIPLKTLESSGEIWIGPDYPVSGYSLGMDDNGDGSVDSLYPENYDGTAEAEKAVGILIDDNKNSNDNRNNSGSIPNPIGVLNIPIIQKSSQINDESEMSYILENENIVIDGNEELDRDIQENNNPYTASANDSGIDVDLTWPVVILFGLILILLAKMFIKL